jgi:hypothetical protein
MLIYWNHVRECSNVWFRRYMLIYWCQTASSPLMDILGMQGPQDYEHLHHVLLQWVSKAPNGHHGSDAFRSRLQKPRKTRDFLAAVQQVCWFRHTVTRALKLHTL